MRTSNHWFAYTRGILILGNWFSSNHQFRVKRLRRLLGLGLLSLGILVFSSLLMNILKLQAAASVSVDTFFVLGGSIQREIYVAQLAKQHPETRVLISQGSEDPCILLVFQQEQAPIRQVWLEKCADTTFDNFYFNIPLLHQWGVRKVKLITSTNHMPRAKWMAQIILGAHGIWVEPDIIEESDIPAKRESVFKTGMDVTRSLVWAVLSQSKFFQPKCFKLIPLAAVNLDDWRNSGFKCERQQELKLY